MRWPCISRHSCITPVVPGETSSGVQSCTSAGGVTSSTCPFRYASIYVLARRRRRRGQKSRWWSRARCGLERRRQFGLYDQLMVFWSPIRPAYILSVASATYPVFIRSLYGLAGIHPVHVRFVRFMSGRRSLNVR